jgi:hypothetical protein
MLNAPVPVLLTVTDADGRASVASRTRGTRHSAAPNPASAKAWLRSYPPRRSRARYIPKR